jgi:hypothetical protein
MRSGTTLLGNIVDRHPEISIFVESFFIPRYYYAQVAFWPLSREANRARLARAIANEPRSVVNAVEVDEQAVARGAEPRVASVLDQVMRRWAADRGAPRWGDKSPGYLTKFPVLQRMFPDARFVHIYRDGRDVLLSVRSLVKWRGWDTNAARIARDWERTLRTARRWGERHPDRYMEVQYERLIGDPGPVVREVAEFAGLDFDPAMLEATGASDLNPALATWERVNAEINPDNFAKWKKKLPAEDVATFEYLAGERLRELGYTISDHAIDAAGRRRAHLDLLAGRVSRPAQFLRRGARFVAGAVRPGSREDADRS